MKSKGELNDGRERAVYRTSKDVPTTAINSVPNAFWIFARLLQIISVGCIVLFLCGLRLVWCSLRGNNHQIHKVIGECLALYAELLGPVFVKFAQVISYRADLLPKGILEPIARLQDRSLPMSPGKARRLAEASLSAAGNEGIFLHFVGTVACGSIAVICCAQVDEAKSVAIKIVRPGTAKRIDLDLACFRSLLSVISHLRLAKDIPIIETFDLIATMIARQADMHAELRNLTWLKNVLERDTNLSMPSPRCDLSTKDVLVMEYIDNAVSFSKAELSDADFRQLSLDLLFALYSMIFKHGFVHCDLHPGNVLVRRGQIVLIDAGLVAVLSNDDRSVFRDFFLALAIGDPVACTSALLASAQVIPPSLDLGALHGDVHRLVATYHGRSAGEFLVAEFVISVFELQRRHRIFGTPKFAAAIWALAMFEGLVRARYPDLDFQAAALPFVAGASSETQSPTAQAGAAP